MDKVRSYRNIGDAVDLLSMLDQLVDVYHQRRRGPDDVPWGGVKLTLRQVKNLLVGVREELALQNAGAHATPAASAQSPAAPARSARPATLAERITRVPSNGGSGAAAAMGAVREVGEVEGETREAEEVPPSTPESH